MGIDDHLDPGEATALSPQELLGLDELLEQSRRGTAADDLRELRAFLTRLPMLGPYNAALVQLQRPGAHYVASRAAWAREFDRHVLPGARPLIILRPFGPVDLVYDIADTDGRPVPDGALDPFRIGGSITEDGLAAFTDLLPKQGILYREQEYGSQLAGRLEPMNPAPAREGTRRTVPLRYAVVVNAQLDPTARLVTVFHELGHLFAKHIEHRAENSVRPARPLDLVSREFEAEIVAWLIAARLGIESPAGEYLAGYVDEDGAVPSFSLQAVVSAAGRIESIAGGLARLTTLLRTGQDTTAEAADGPHQQMLDLDPPL